MRKHWSVIRSLQDGVSGWRVRTRVPVAAARWFEDEADARAVCARCNAGRSLEEALADLRARIAAAGWTPLWARQGPR